jgi:hypothetical protein
MTIKNTLQITGFLAALMLADSAVAYTDKEPEEICKDPKFKGFNLPIYNAAEKKEVPPEAELSFTVSGWTNPETLVVTAKNQPLELSIENKNIFYRIKAKLPPSLNGKFVRINASARAVLGCKGEDGWLLKVADTQAPAEEKTPSAQAVSSPAKTAE